MSAPYKFVVHTYYILLRLCKAHTLSTLSPGYLRPLNISYDPDCYYVRLVHRKPRCQYDIYPMTRHLDGVATDGESVERVWALQSRSKM